MTLFGGIEAGGTKFVCAVGNGSGDYKDEIRFPTTTPEETIGRAIKFFQSQPGIVSAIGVGSFGPVDLNPKSPKFGHITSTPKPGWGNTDFVGALNATFNVPIGFDTDVNTATLGEHRWGAAQGLDTFLYLTIGTGIGGGAMVEGGLLHGLTHPEMGHIHLPHDWERDPYSGFCPYHGDCFEGLAAGPAMEIRWGQRAETIPEGHPAWELEAEYIALALVNYINILSPQKIVLGGGVMEAPQLFPLVRQKTLQILNGYLQTPKIINEIDSYLVPPKLGNKAGVLGAIALAQQEYKL
ncbi:MAG: ROK family protein [Candidatus Electryonea clarkiae]|nr:ROK family protein [Candidatus Electryonea clarkiae]